MLKISIVCFIHLNNYVLEFLAFSSLFEATLWNQHLASLTVSSLGLTEINALALSF